MLDRNQTHDTHYGLSFLGKQEANALYNAPATKELKGEPDRSSEFDTTGNAIIIGDNLHALKTLRTAYYGKVKTIYIDPPYACTDINSIDKELAFIKDKFGSSHSSWLSFMYPRLRLARDLLRDDGVIFISIDDNEQANLKILCDEIFGEHNFITQISVVNNLKGANNTCGIVSVNEYCLIYAKDTSCVTIGEVALREEDEKELAKWKEDDFGYWKKGGQLKSSGKQAQVKKSKNDYPIYLNDELEISLEKSEEFYIEVLPTTTDQKIVGWTWNKDHLSDNRHNLIVEKTSRGYDIFKKTRPTSMVPSKRLKTTCYSPRYSFSTSSQTIKDLFGDSILICSKSVYLVRDFLEISTKDDDIVMDFFAGSGTTAHAVMELNAEDRNNGKQGNRKFILVQLDEAIKQDGKDKIVYDFCKGLGSENPTIADITIERVKRAGEKIRGEQIKKEKGGDSTIDTGFKVFSLIDKQRLNPQEQDLLTLASSPLTPYQKAINLALHAGRTLDTRIQPVIEGKLYRDERNFYLIACDKEVQKHLTADKNKDIFLSGYEDIAIQDLLNLQASIQKTRLKVLF